MKVKVTTNFVHKEGLPKYETEFSAGMDLRANIEEKIVLQPGHRVLIPTGIKAEVPVGYEIQIRPRSGLALKSGITVLNAPGTIDSDYRGDIGVILYNASDKGFVIETGDRIGQAVLNKFEKIEWSEEGELSKTERGEGGFGHTGVKATKENKKPKVEEAPEEK